MALSSSERRDLDLIEAWLMREEPALAASLAGVRSSEPTWRHAFHAAVVLVLFSLAPALVVVALATRTPAVIVGCPLAPGLAFLWSLRFWCPHCPPTAGPPGPSCNT